MRDLHTFEIMLILVGSISVTFIAFAIASWYFVKAYIGSK